MIDQQVIIDEYKAEYDARSIRIYLSWFCSRPQF